MTNGAKQYNEGHADQSVQWIASGEAPLASSPLLLDGFLLRIFSDIPELPQWWSRQRDAFLRTRLQSNSLISGIVYGEATRIRNMPYVLTHEDDNQEELSKWQNLLQLANFGRGFPVFASKIATDYLTQDNGCFFEILGAGEIKLVNETFYRRVIENGIQREVPYTTTFLAKGERTGQATGIAYLDAGQCWRTMNPEYPVIYTNPYTGQLVVLHWTRVSYDSQFPQGYELARDVGLCALSRAYETMRQVKAINTYYYEKVTGQSAEIIYANQPVSKLDSAVQAAMFQSDNAGFSVFKNTMLLAPKSGGVGAQDLKFDKIGLRDQPDGFSYREQMDIAVNILAQAFGVDVREIWAAAQTGATKADAEVQDIKTTGKGRADILSMLENAINWRVLPPEITFKFDEVDDLSDKRKSEIKQIRVNTRATQIQSGELNLEEAREMAAEDGDIMPEFLERIATADDATSVEAVNPSSADEQPKENAPDEDEAEDSENDEKALAKGEKAYSQTRSLFFSNMINFCELAIAGQLSSRNFVSSVKSELQLAIRSSFIEGIRTGAGSFSINQAELSDDEIAVQNQLIGIAIGYVSNLRDFVYGDPQPTFIEVIQRVALWARKSLDTAFSTGQLMGAGNKVMGWRLGFREKHCATCLAASKQRHRAKTWAKYKLMPHGDNLECKGFNCDCEFYETNEGIAGRIDRIPLIEGKHVHMETV